MKDKSQKKSNPTEVAKKINRMKNTDTDPMGSYTGSPKEPAERPVQDADDL
ncbi:MAG: hypothetical protein RR540_03125 [Oscillospiraceae bacterium]